MQKKLHIYIIILTLGFFLLPNLNYGCGAKVEKKCCKQETSSKIENKECCNGKDSNKKDKPCGGKCGHSNCTASSVSLSIISPDEFKINASAFDFSTEKPKIYNSKTFISSGFTSVWSPPNIK
ncbi:hypothetical protein [Flavobacterium sp.]